MGDRYECQNDGLDTLDAMETGGGGRESGREGVSQYALVEHAGRDGGGVGAEEILEGFFFLEGAAVADRAIAPIFVDSLDAFVVFGRDLREEWGEGGGERFFFQNSNLNVGMDSYGCHDGPDTRDTTNEEWRKGGKGGRE